MHDVYVHRHHPHVHHHHHPAGHHGGHRDPRYGSLLVPSVRAARIAAPQGDGAKADPATVTSATSAWAGAFHGTVDIVPSFGFDAGNVGWVGFVAVTRPSRDVSSSGLALRVVSKCISLLYLLSRQLSLPFPETLLSAR